jgi:LPS export ABC transporter protein LptC
MHLSAKHGLLLTALFTGTLLLVACENDIKQIKRLAAARNSIPVDSTTQVDVIYSDSARVKLHMTSPLLLRHTDDKHPEKDFDEMPHGVKIVFYDSLRRETGNIVADSAIQHPQAKLIEFHKNVVATNAQGDTYRSDELIWDQGTHKIYSHQMVTITNANGNVTTGSPFSSDEKLQKPDLKNAKGIYHVTDMPEN